jgi:hypothetical protein
MGWRENYTSGWQLPPPPHREDMVTCYVAKCYPPPPLQVPTDGKGGGGAVSLRLNIVGRLAKNGK